MRLIPLNVRASEDAPRDDEIEAALIVLRHPDEPEPWLISSDNATRIAAFPQPRYATLSTWQSEGPARPFAFVAMGVLVPDEGEEATAQTQLVVENTDARLIEIVTSDARRLVTADLAVVRASDPDVVLFEHRGLELGSSQFDASKLVFDLQGTLLLDENYPADEITEARFPALYGA